MIKAMSARKQRIEYDGVVELLTRVLWKMPKLDGCLCRGKAGIFDAPYQHMRERALALCSSCPCLAQCQQFAEGEKVKTGVLAGHHYGTATRDEEDE